MTARCASMIAAAMLMAGLPSANAVRAGLKDRLPPDAYIDPVDQTIARTGKGIAGRPFPCAREAVEQGIRIIRSIPTEQCVRMSAPQRWAGLWRNDFEGSIFCPTPAKSCSGRSDGDEIWLERGPLRGERGAVYAIEFVGRKTLYKGPYGHLGMSDHAIIIDHVISTKMVKAPPPPMSQADLIAEMRRCKAAGTCIPSPEMEALMARGQ